MAAAGGSGGEGIGSSGGGSGQAAAAQLIEAARKGQEEVDGMGKAEVLAFEVRLRALKLRVLRRIKEKEKKAAATTKAEQQHAAGAPRRSSYAVLWSIN